MTEPVPDKRGFEHKNVFYEYVLLTDWFNRDFTLARTLTRVGIDELLSGRDYNAIQQASLAVAVWHANPDQQMDRIIAFVQTMKPAEITEVGFQDDDGEGDAGPPDVPASSATPSNSPETGENSSEQS
jgi:hypothetical protein